jgi:hypothetical protein
MSRADIFSVREVSPFIMYTAIPLYVNPHEYPSGGWFADWAVSTASFFLFCVAARYFLGTLIYLAMRVWGSVSQARARKFLDSMFKFYHQFSTDKNKHVVNRETIKRTGQQAWSVVSFAAMLGLFHAYSSPLLGWTLDAVIAAVVVFFAGLPVGLSWYGLHCFQLLKIESYEAPVSDRELASAH